MSCKTIAMSSVLSLLLCGVALGQGASEAYGTIVDSAKNPIEGVMVSFRPQSNPTMAYSGKSNKKGKYFVAGLFTSKEDDMWNITVESEKYVAIHFVVESRNVNRVLIGDIMEANLAFDAKIPEVPIRPLGRVRVDLVVAPAEDVQAEAQAAATSAAVSAAQAGATGAAAGTAQAQGDPWAEALTLVSAGDLAGSLPLFLKAIEAAPDDAERHATQAKVLFELGRFDEAAAAARRSIELGPARIDARQVLSSAQMKRGDLAGARATLVAALEVAPTDVDLHERLAFVAGEMGDKAGSIAEYVKITEIAPNDVDAWLALGGLYAQAGDPVRSEQAYQKVTELRPSEAYQTFYNLGVVIMNRTDRTEADTRRAIDAFRKAVEIKPDYGQAYQQLAYALLGMGDRPGALEALEAYVRVDPRSADAARMKGMIDTLKKSP